MNAIVALPNSGTRTTRLGIGLATLMREPSRKAQLRLLDTAYDTGFRHFDVAPSYGLGAAEGVLGRFLARCPSGVTVATKVGIVVQRRFIGLQSVQRPLRTLIRRFPALRGRATRAVGSAMHRRSNFALDMCTKSLERSLNVLRVDAIDLLLLHDPDPSDLADGSLFDWLSQQKLHGRVRNTGLATSPEIAFSILSSQASVDVVQVPSNVFAPAVATIVGMAPATLRITHSAIAYPMARITERMSADPSWTARFSDCAGVDVREPGVVPRLLLSWALHENLHGIVLLGASKEDHFRQAAEAADTLDTSRAERITNFLNSTVSA